MKHIIFSPIYQERVWGGTQFASQLGRALPPGKVIGESWEIVDRPEAQSTTAGGETLRELLRKDPTRIMGAGWSADKPFPILVKWLDCHEKLSLQVHPPARIAASLQGEAKTENWYIAAAEPHATVMAGLKNGVTREDFKIGLKQNQVESLVHSIPVKAGESIFIPSGRVHAIGGGNLILEIQQNSDTTYRVYDWGRFGLDGKPRQLHVEASLQCMDFDDFEPDTLKPSNAREQLLAQSDVFKLRKIRLEPGETLSFGAGSPRILSIVSGSLKEKDDSTLARGDNALLPAHFDFEYSATTQSEVLVTEDFN